VIVVAAGSGSVRVDGRFKPGKEVNKTLNIGDSMIDIIVEK